MAAVMFQGPPFLEVGGSFGPHFIILDPSLSSGSTILERGPTSPQFWKWGSLKQNMGHCFGVMNNTCQFRYFQRGTVPHMFF